jgi:hypothetical protein
MRGRSLLAVTAFGEGGIGLLLLALPSVPRALLHGTNRASSEATFFARIAGAALLAIAIACWLARTDTNSRTSFGMIAAICFYDVAASLLLTYAGLFLKLAGIALWPAVALHAALATWCAVCLVPRAAREPAA